MPSKKYEPSAEEIAKFPKRKNLRFATQNNAWLVRYIVNKKLHCVYFTLLRHDNSMELAYTRACEYLDKLERGEEVSEQ